MDQGFGAVDLNTTLPTSASDANVRLLVVGNYGTWCSSCVNVPTNQSLTYSYQASRERDQG